MRNAFADEVTKLGASDSRVVMLSGDIGNRLFDKFKDKCPTRFFNCGVAEQNMMGFAAGLAMSGLRPVVYTITPFVTSRCYEQIKIDVCYQEAPVTIVSVGGGLSYASLGPTHHSCEDIAILRALPNLRIVCPGDAWEVRAALRAAVSQDRPTYIRLAKRGEPTFHSQVPDNFAIGKALPMRSGKTICLLSTGNMLPEAYEAADLLAKNGSAPAVVSFHTVKPLDTDFLADAFARYELVVTIEEHGLVGGLGAAIAEWRNDAGIGGARLVRVGTPDAFYKLSGEQEHAREVLNLTGHKIAERIQATLG